MLELRFHGRGGQGGVTSAELLALSAIEGGKFAQAFPSFGPERRGAPVKAFARISDTQIRNRTAVTCPNITLVLDPSLLTIVDTSEGLTADGLQVVNSTQSIEHLKNKTGLKGRLVVVDANKIAAEEIGRVITNTTMLGALVRATGIVSKEVLIGQLKQRFGRIAEGNINAFNRSYEECVVEN